MQVWRSCILGMECNEGFFFNIFSNIDDPRSCRNQVHNFITLIGTSFCAVLSGIDSFSGIEDFVEIHYEELKEYFDLSGGVPSHDTYQRLWESISPTQFRESFLDFVDSLQKVCSEIVSIDGKTIRNSGHEKPLNIVSAWCYNNQMVFAQEKTHAKSNEITAISELLRKLDLKGKIITIDAAGAQRNICEQITSGGGNYVIALKGNQKSLYEDVKAFLQEERNHKFSNESNDKGHGRIEQRTAFVSHDVESLQKIHNWPGLCSIGRVVSKVIKKGKETEESRYYISSLPLDAQKLNDIARKHWGIENKLHWRLDVIFNEDKSCILNDNAAENMNFIRKWALTILVKAKKKPSQSVISVIRRNSMSVSHFLNSVKKILHA
jgi:predicted transposase YbfD/YdcC